MTAIHSRPTPLACLAIQDGRIEVPGLDGPVTIVRDRWGIPHIKATTAHDAYFAQGYCMAQDRAWQIEMIRQMAHGRAAALLNRGLLRLDQQNRMLGFGRLAAKEWEHQTPAAKAVLQAYADGINAAIATNPVPFEFRTIGHTMQPWSPVDSLAIIKMVNANQQWASKLKFGQIAAHFGTDVLRALLPDMPKGSAVIVPSGVRWAGEPHPFTDAELRELIDPDGPVPSGGGSNCWVFAGSRTESGAPLVAGDPHLPMSLPGQWFVLHMECPEFTVAGPCNPGYPGPAFYGHNTKVAWTMTHAMGDRWDVYRERIRRGANGPEAQFGDRWEPLERREERIEVRGEEPVTTTVWSTRHGPVISGDPATDGEVLTARWGLAEPAHDIDAVIALAKASNAAEAQAAIRTLDSISGNYCFADRAGDIGYQYSGRIPKRPGWVVPVPGWDGAHEWQGDIPKEELPFERNPANGYLLTANNRTTTPDYAHYLSFMSTRFRADRLRELIEAQDRFSPDDARRLQADVTSVHARQLGRWLGALPGANGPAARLQTLLRDWDGSMAPDSAAAVAFDRICDALSARTTRAFFANATQVPDALLLEERRQLLAESADASRTFLVQDPSWEAAGLAALDAAAATLEAEFGADPAAWRWGNIHTLQWRHNLGREADLASLLNLPPVPLGGDGNTPFNAAYERDGGVTVSVSYRQILDLADLNAARVCIPPGNSGQPGSPHYADNVERWRAVDYHPLHINWSDIEANREGTLELVPGRH